VTAILRQLPTDNDFVKKRLAVLERWISDNRLEPWLAVVLAEWVRTSDGRRGQVPSMEQFESLFEGETLEAMREQVDGPWMIYADQARAQRSNRSVMSFLIALEDAIAADTSS